MTKVHVLADESLGGVLREYVEVDRPAEVGDYVIRDGIIREVEKRSDVWDGVEFDPYLDDDGEDTFGWNDDYYKTLEPIDIIHVDGKRYRMVERKAKVGDKVLINGHVCEKANGIFIVDKVEQNGHIQYGKYGRRPYGYKVLIPLESTNDPDPIIDLIANLARRVTSLERQLADTQHNLEKFAQQTESNTHDIAFLEERTASTPSLTFNESQLTAVLRAAMVAAGGDGE